MPGSTLPVQKPIPIWFGGHADKASRWRELGAIHISVDTMNAGMLSLEDHIDTLERFKEVVTGI